MSTPSTLIVPPTGPLRGQVDVVGDKSISHRALFLAALAEGESQIYNLSPAQDVASTQVVLQALGAEIMGAEIAADKTSVRVRPGWRTPSGPLMCGNSGTTARTVMGALLAQGLGARLEGDASLSRRAMGPVVRALQGFGLRAELSQGHLPAHIVPGALRAAEVHIDNGSAQIKTACLLAALRAKGTSRITESRPARDHTERMLPVFGGHCTVTGSGVTVTGPQSLRGAELHIPGDVSAAAFVVVAASLIPGSDVTLRGVGLNPFRVAYLEVLRRMGAHIEITETGCMGDEPVGRVRVRAARLRGIEIPADWAPRLIDEYPILSVAAAFADGITEFRGAEALRDKECDRLAASAQNLRSAGVVVEAFADGLRITSGGIRQTALRLDGFGDHRMVMANAVLLMAREDQAEAGMVTTAEAMAISDPEFVSRFQSLGGLMSMAPVQPSVSVWT